jgi:hypothetical protein
MPRLLVAPFAAIGAAIRDAGRRTWGLAAGYFAAALVILAGVAALVDAFGGGLRKWLQLILFPGEQQPVADLALNVAFHTQSRTITANLTATTGLVLVSLLLFFIKEALSRGIEQDLVKRHPAPPDDAPTDFPWWREGLEEIGLLFVYAALFVGVFALGQTVDPTRRTLAEVLSWLVLFWTWAVDFVAPPLFRRRIGYRGVFRLIARYPLPCLVFGALMSLPVVAVEIFAATLDATPRMVLTVASQAFMIVLATFGGTRLALVRLFAVTLEERLNLQKPSAPVVRVSAALVIGAVLVFGAWVGTGLARALVAKSQILKCSWSLAPGTLKLDLPDPDPVGWLTGRPVAVGVGVDLLVTNPTDLPVAVEPTRIEVADDGQVIARTTLAPFQVNANAAARQRLALTVEVHPDVFLKGASLDPRAWSIALWVKLEGGLDFPIPLVVPSL